MNFRAAEDPQAAGPEASAENPPRAMSLAVARIGQLLEVAGVDGDDALAHRLRASGLWPGTPIELVAVAPFGDPLLFKLHGFRLALRRSEAARVCAVIVESHE